MSGKLIVGSMPLGNLGDMTLRMVDAFHDCDVIFSDNMPNTAYEVLKKYKLDKEVIVLNSTDSRIADIDQINLMSEYITSGKTVLLIATEGQVGIADPGFQFIQEAIKRKFDYTVLPGPSAFITAYVHSAHILGRFSIQETIHYDIDGIINSYQNSKQPVVFHVWSKDVREMAQSLNKHFKNQNRVITLCCNMSLPDEFIIRDLAKDLINNKELDRFNKHVHVTAVLSQELEEKDIIL